MLGLLDIILSWNHFLFQVIIFVQVHGTAMGSNVVLAYANIHMGRLKQDLVYVLCHFTHEMARWWWLLNNRDYAIQFLGTLVNLGYECLGTALFIKKTDRNHMLHFKDQHPWLTCFHIVNSNGSIKLFENKIIWQRWFYEYALNLRKTFPQLWLLHSIEH